MVAQRKSATGTGKQDEKETARCAENRAESGTVCAMVQTTALEAASLADSSLELCFEERLAKIVSVPILFCSQKARQPEGSAFFMHHRPPPVPDCYQLHRLPLRNEARRYNGSHLYAAGES